MKKALLSSIVLASLLLVGCGGDDDPKKDDNTTTEQPDNNGTDNNESNSSTINPNNVVLNGLEWTPLIVRNENNASKSGKVYYDKNSQANVNGLDGAVEICQNKGMRLPTLAELNATLVSEENATSKLKLDPKFNFDNAVESNENPTALIIWAKDQDKGFALYKDDNKDGEYNARHDEGTQFYTCVKPIE